MKPYETWKNMTEMEMSPEQYAQFWKEYLAEEKKIYQQVLKGPQKLEGTIADLSKIYGTNDITFTGFLDGINNSLVTTLELDDLESDTIFTLDIDLEKLYYNMHDAKAKWLFNIKEWETLLSKDQRRDIKKAYRDSVVIVKKVKIGRNDPCPCGSGKKYKKCCMSKETE
jgi:preprotein translocase subunit SecA